MRKYVSLLFLTIVIVKIYAQNKNVYSTREVFSLNKNWKFHLGNAADAQKDFNYGIGLNFTIANGGSGCIEPKYNDSAWRTLNVPHDWVVELPFTFNENFEVYRHGYKPVGGLYPNNSIGWYRKTFFVNRADSGSRYILRFDGVFRDYKVWLNNNYIGGSFSGYSEASFDVTDYIDHKTKNVLVVRVDATQYEGWFYEGAGIYRNVWLEKLNPVHIPEYGVYIHTDVVNNKAAVHVETQVHNKSEAFTNCILSSYITDSSGKNISEEFTQTVFVKRSETIKLNNTINISNPVLWDIDNPYLYRMVTLVKVDGRVVDSVNTLFGIRTLRFDAEKGFFLNGRNIKIKGMCNHQDHAGVGTALPESLNYYRIKKLKEMGVNAYRSRHNPPTKEILDACDKIGMLVLDENRMMGTGPEYLSQFEKLILRDRNHPSIFMWSIGNEETGVHNKEIGKRLAHTMLLRQKELDPSRTSTYAGNNGINYLGINEELEVRGFNYHIKEIDDYHNAHPEQPVFFTECASMVSTRGIYQKDTMNGYLPDYDSTYPGWGTTSERWWKFVEDRPWMMGGFVWTGFDYRGEPTPFTWPCINSHFGVMDVCGFPKNSYYYYQSWWTDKDVIKLYPHWNWKGKEGDTIEVWCNSNADEVELKLNGKSLGRKAMPRNGHLQWNVAYKSGKLEAIGKKKGRILHTQVETTDIPNQIVLTPDRTILTADGEDATVVNVSVIDDKGREVPDAINLIKFDITGNGRIIGIGNGDPSSHESDKYFDNNWQRKLFGGKCQVIVQSFDKVGTFILNAQSEGVKNASTIIKTINSQKKKFITEKVSNENKEQ
jgi:beta-galactosidase